MIKDMPSKCKIENSVKATAWILICTFVQKIISIITIPIFTRLLSTNDYGQYNVFNSWLEMITVFVTFRLYYGVYPQGLVKYKDDRHVFENSVKSLNNTLVFIWCIVYLLLSDYINKLLGLSKGLMILMIAMIFTSSQLEYWFAERRMDLDYKAIFLITIIISFFRPLLSVVMIITSYNKVFARVEGAVIADFIAWFIIYVFFSSNQKMFSTKYWKYAIEFNFPLIPHYLSQSILNSADRIMISRMIGDEQSGIYSLAYSLAMVMLVLNQTIMSVLSPWIYNNIKCHKEGKIRSISISVINIIGIFIIALIALAPEIIAVFAPKEYYEAIYVIPPIAMSVFFIMCYEMFVRFEFFYEKTIYITIVSLICSVLNIVLNILFIKIFGYIAAAYTTLICYILYAYGHYFIIRIIDKNSIKAFDIKKILFISLRFGIIGFALLISYKYMLLRYIFIVFLLCILTKYFSKIKGCFMQVVNINKSSFY